MKIFVIRAIRSVNGVVKSASAALLALFLTSAGTFAAEPTWETYSDTWVGTDALGRTLPTAEQTGPPHTNKMVGIFYFLWLGHHGKTLYDNTRILAANPTNAQYGPKGAFHHWGEPAFGYYLSDDEAVIRKHAQMLADAGVDVLIFDVTNGFIYEDVVQVAGRVLMQMRRDGLRTPQFAFIGHSGEGKVAQSLYDKIYSRGLFSELWFRWQGKPLLLVNPDALTPSLREFFTVRESWAWTKGHKWFGDGKDKWPWLDFYPQHYGWHENPQKPEHISVNVAQHPVSNIGRSFHDGKEPPPDQRAPGRGLCFAEQWRQALKVSPEFVFITGWNEWVAQRFISDKGGQTFLGKPLPPGGTFFVDQYNQEFSRDIEPMRGGHGDNYFYQMVDGIRRYKGVRKIQAITPRPIVIDGRFNDWQEVAPEYRDTIGDPVQRSHPGWTGAGRYTNSSGRNDIVAAKISYDEQNVYFYVRSRNPLTPHADPNWMLLFIDADQNPTNGWLGYDFVVNHRPAQPETLILEKHDQSGYQWTGATKIAYRTLGTELELAIPRVALGITQFPSAIDFKWADNITKAGGSTDFTLNGDAAPNDRFNYRARLK